MSAVMKPPNVLIYTGDNNHQLYKNIEINLLQCLHPENYVVYPLTSSQVLREPWKENLELLIISCCRIQDDIEKQFKQYVEKDGGKMLMFCTKFNTPIARILCEETTSAEGLHNLNFKSFDNLVVYRGKYSYRSLQSNVLCRDPVDNPLIQKAIFEGGIFIASEIHLELDSSVLHVTEADCAVLNQNNAQRIEILGTVLTEHFGIEKPSSNVPELSAGYFITDHRSTEKCVGKITEIPVQNDVKGYENESFVSSIIRLPIIHPDDRDSLDFDRLLYFSNLKTESYGHSVVFFPVITSTMAPAKHFSDYEGIVVIAKCQISGHGRSANKWIGPDGCAMFTLHFTLPLSSLLGQKMSVLQHISALSIVRGIRKHSGYENLDLKLKWPNDIYYGKEKKVGGVIANTTIQGNLAHVYLGCGVNVSNRRPTFCVNDAIDSYNLSNDKCLPHFRVEEVIALSVTEIEHFVKDFMGSGSQNVLSEYYSYWMHTNQRVKLNSLNEEGIVLGIDDYGFLIVQTDRGQTLVLQPDGNRFDIMKNLILTKH